ncbi:FGGY-family carbohydrate kinase [Ruminococcus sp. CLA-AA-H200]|uniref:FGGY-family carbohydrate kinase n=1 Tax=Ruminococcus turbiniformis TaxID=2881258 RepID=A0ABS8FVL5_9FIRM|nr:FGGY-family carbohydrate kinase [Ruminococcus turbiniformis]MCC2254085.1 FGGY-family carbohydrate kinase [Ruminococcus turbiniformis]
MQNKEEIRELISAGRAILGIELGSTRIKGVLIGEDRAPIASGSYEWENKLVNHIWTYDIEDVWKGLQGCYSDLVKDVEEQYGVQLKKLAAIGVSAMMHGYLAFGGDDELLVPFRTWRNTITGEAAEKLSALFSYNIPQRWSIAHLYQAILNGEDHVADVRFFTTLAGYIHWKLTGEKVIGNGDASGMFPIDIATKDYDSRMLDQFDELVADKGYPWKIRELLPKVLLAGEDAGKVTEEGARLLDPTGNLEAGIPMCPPEGDAGTGMTATNSVEVRTGNVSAGTSVFAMTVLEKDLSKPYEEIDMVTTPAGDLVAMVHCNNCTSDLNAWVGLFREFAESFGMEVDMNKLFGTLYNKALEGDPDCGGLLAYNYFSGETITGFDEGRPLFVRSPESKFNLANFMRVHLCTSLGALKTGMDILLKQEDVKLDRMMGHGGLFKTKGVGQRILAAAIDTPVCVMETAGEGGAWGIALLADYLVRKDEGESLTDYLNNKVFGDTEGTVMDPVAEDVDGYEKFMETYKKGLAIERAAVDAGI